MAPHGTGLNPGMHAVRAPTDARPSIRFWRATACPACGPAAPRPARPPVPSHPSGRPSWRGPQHRSEPPARSHGPEPPRAGVRLAGRAGAGRRPPPRCSRGPGPSPGRQLASKSIAITGRASSGSASKVVISSSLPPSHPRASSNGGRLRLTSLPAVRAPSEDRVPPPGRFVAETRRP